MSPARPDISIGARRERPPVVGVVIVLMISHAIMLAFGLALGLWIGG